MQIKPTWQDKSRTYVVSNSTIKDIRRVSCLVFKRLEPYEWERQRTLGCLLRQYVEAHFLGHLPG
jgi:hypothetical protein